MKKLLFAASILLIILTVVSCGNVQEVIQNVEGAKMVARITDITENSIMVEVIEGDYEVSGPYNVRISTDTIICNDNAEKLSLWFLNVGDVVEITYSGQVMLSYPPQIVAKIIKVK
jgi:hypothetical protein